MNKKSKGFLALSATALLAVAIGGCGILPSETSGGVKEHPSAAGQEGQAEPAGGAGAEKGQDSGKAPANAPVKKPSLEDTIREVNGVPTVTNPDDVTVLVNKQRALPADYIPPDLVEPQVPFPYEEKVEKRLMRAEAARALEALFLKAEMDGIKLYAVSGYRSYRTQKSLYETYVQTQGPEHAAAFSAEPGKSEHQTGLAMDVSGADSETRLEQSFADTPEGKWLEANCADFGFVIRYPKGKEAITGYAYEPWHLRYVGTEIAKEVMSRGLTLEEYFSP